MRQIQIDLILRFRMPESGLNVNGVLMGLGNANARISFAYFGLYSLPLRVALYQNIVSIPRRPLRRGLAQWCIYRIVGLPKRWQEFGSRHHQHRPVPCIVV